jgi:hypothetical protein
MGTSASTPSPLPSAETTAGLSTASRIVNVFVSPSTTFTDLKRDPSWWVAWVLISVFSLLFVLTMQQKVGFAQIMQNEISSSPKAVERMEKLTPEQRAQQMEIGTAISKYISYAIPVVVLIIAAIMAAVLMGTFNFGTGAEISYPVSLAVVIYAMIPGILKSVLAAISLYAGADPESFNSRNPVATNLGFFLSRTDHPVLYSLASSVDLFGIWMVILLGIGYSCVSKVKKSTAIGIVAGWYVLLALLGAGWTAVMG